MKESKNNNYFIRNRVLYKACPSCSEKIKHEVFYECPKLFGYIGSIIQNECNNCKSKSTEGPHEGYVFKSVKDKIIPEVRILPMGKEEFTDINACKTFLTKEMPERGNTFYYKTHNMVTKYNSLILFQYDAEIVAYGFFETEKEEKDNEYKGYYKFIDNSVIFLNTPITNEKMQQLFNITLAQTTTRVSIDYLPKLYELLINSESELKGNRLIDCNEKRIKTKKDWLDILNNEDPENNIVLETLFYMMGCKNYLSNGNNIARALGLANIPNLDFVHFGKRIIQLKQIDEQLGDDGNYRYWNIPFITDFSKNKNGVFTWKIREELAEALIEKYNLPSREKDSIEKQFEEYKELLPQEEYEKRIADDKKVLDEFVNRFDINYIMNMGIDDYVTGRSTIDDTGKNSFCYLLEFKMRQLGDMRGATVEKFGIWYSKEDNMYRNLSKYGETIEKAFKTIKQELCKLIVAGNNDDYNSIKESLFPPLFKGKILSTYFPEKYLCIFKEEDIDIFLNILGISYDLYKVDTIEKKKRLLKEFKDNHSIFKNYSDYYFVLFLYNSFKKELKEKHTVNGVIDYKIELKNFNYLGSHKKEQKQTYRSRETDYERINKNKKDIGNRGETAVLQYEKKHLEKIGLFDLSAKVEIVENDAIGYDVLSYEEDGKEKHIEVKTNSGNSNEILDFYLTDNELRKMITDSNYYIYYLYNIKSKPKMHIINKKILLSEKEKYLQPILYKISIDVEEK